MLTPLQQDKIISIIRNSDKPELAQCFDRIPEAYQHALHLLGYEQIATSLKNYRIVQDVAAILDGHEPDYCKEYLNRV